MAKYFLRKKQGDRIVHGHPWVFANEIGDNEGTANAGDIVELYSYNGTFVGKGFYNPNSQIRIRVLTNNKEEEINEEFFKQKILSAWKYRQLLSFTENCRVFFSESDGISGLIIDKYGDYFVIQTLSFGIDQWKESIVNIINSIWLPKGIYERNDVYVRTFEGLSQEKGFLSAPFNTKINIKEHGLELAIDIENGQRTGYHLDHTQNRQSIRPIVKDADVLDAFCNTGGFSLNAAQFGAKTVTGIDNSDIDLEVARQNARQNGFDNVCTFNTANAFDRLKELVKEKKAYDVVILDPPPLAKSRKSIDKALAGYKEINLRAIQLLKKEGFLITTCSSSLVNNEQFKTTLAAAAADVGCNLKLVHSGSQSPDHPVVLNIPTTQYLQFYIFQIM